jgi:hypothetical protein
MPVIIPKIYVFCFICQRSTEQTLHSHEDVDIYQCHTKPHSTYWPPGARTDQGEPLLIRQGDAARDVSDFKRTEHDGKRSYMKDKERKELGLE